jgi:1-acyl-sn-glycerol-3-phosphate acyltransferase
MIKILKYIWAVYFFIWFLVILLVLYPAFLILLSKEKWYAKGHTLRRYWGRTLMFVSGLRSKVVYEEALSKKKTYIFTPNHFSYFDIVSVNSQMPFYFSFMAKKELADIPVFGIFSRTLDIPVDRKSLEGAKRAYFDAKRKLNAGISLLNFPEGGIGKTVPKMRKFKMGPFKLAIEHGLEIVPITLADNWKRLPSGGLASGGTPGKMRMYVHRPIPTKNLKPGDEVELANKVYRIIEEKFNEMNAL